MGIILKIITPERKVFEGEVEMVTAPGIAGEFGVLPGHTPFITTLIAGELHFDAKGKKEGYAISGGYIEVNEDKMTVLADSAEHFEEIDIERAKLAQKKAVEILNAADPTSLEFKKAEIKLKRSLVRQKVWSMRNK
ncbi:MAG: F0F1 ATP synthase subunit epsilon [Myxococcota bacterium]